MHPLATYWFKHDIPVVLRSPAELDAMLDALTDAPDGYNVAGLWVDDERYDGRPTASTHSMRIGMYGRIGSIFYGDDKPGPDYEPGAWYSVGDPTAAGEVTYRDGVDGEYFHPTSSVISLELIRKAVHEFADTGRRPTCVTWQDWRPPLVETGPADDSTDNWF